MPVIKWLGKLLLWTVIIVIVLVGALVLVNAVDEDLRPEAVAALKPASGGAPDQENGFFVVQGFNAPSGENPHEYGRRWVAEIAAASTGQVQAVNSRYNRGPLDFKEMKEPICRPDSESCLDKARRDAVETRRLIAANEELFRRYESLYRYPRFEDRSPIRLELPITPLSQYLKAQGLKLAQIALMFEEGEADAALRELEHDIALQRKFAAGSSLLVSKMIAMIALSRDQLLVSEILRSRRAEPASRAEIIRALSAPLGPGERSMDGVIAAEFLFSASSLRLTKSGELKVAFGEAFGKNFGLLDSVLMMLGDMESIAEYKGKYAFLDPVIQLFLCEKATLNLHWERFHRLAEIYRGPSSEQDGKIRALQQQAQDQIFSWRTAYNPLGKLMLSGSIGAWQDYFARILDVDGLSRLLALQAEIVLQEIPNSEIPRFLASSDRKYFDPYTEKPMQWDPAARQIWFKPASPKALRDRIGGREGRLAVGL